MIGAKMTRPRTVGCWLLPFLSRQGFRMFQFRSVPTVLIDNRKKEKIFFFAKSDLSPPPHVFAGRSFSIGKVTVGVYFLHA